MTTKILAAVVAALCVTTVTAQGNQALKSYQSELSGGFQMSEVDTNPDIEMTSLFVTGEYHFKPVELKDHPWNEAAFLEHSTFLSATLDYTQFEIASFDADGPTIGASYRYATPDQPIAAEVGFLFGTLDGDLGVDIDQTLFGGNVGYWVQPNAIVGIEFSLEEFEIGSAELETLQFGGFGKIVHDLDDQRSVNAEAHVGIVNADDGATDETNVEIGVAGDYYFTRQYSAGAMLDFSFGDAASEEGVTYGVRGSAWLTPAVSVSGAFSMFSASDSTGADETDFGILFSMRF